MFKLIQRKGLLFYLSSLLILIILVIYLIFSVLKWNEKKINTITITGQLTHVSKKNIELSVKKQLKNIGFFSVNVNKLKENIEAKYSWIYQVQVTKKWPDILNINVKEQEPYAIWNRKYILNDYGEIFSSVSKDKYINLVKLDGPEKKELSVFKKYKILSSILSHDSKQMKILKVNCSEINSWEVILNNKILLYLGSEDLIKRFRRFIKIYPYILKQNKPIKYVDLRYKKGVAVGWR